MTKNKKTNDLTLWRQWRQSPRFFKNLFVAVFFLILLVISLLLVWKIYINKGKVEQQVTLSPPVSSTQVAQTPAIESVPSLQPPLESSSLPIQRSLLRDVVEGETSFKTFKILLQNTPETWAQTLLTQLAPIIDDIKNYPQLEELLELSIPPERPSFVERIKAMFRSPSPMSRTKEKREYKAGWMGIVQNSLRDRDIQSALYYFQKLSPQEKSQLTSWNEYAQRLLRFETIMKTDTVSESPEVQAQKALQIEHKLAAYALLKGVMEGSFSPETLVKFLQKASEPWAQNLSAKLFPILNDIGSYPKLEEILVAFSPLRSVKKPIHIRKINKRGDYENVEVEDIQKALHDHDLQKILNYYEGLPSEKKILLKDFYDYTTRLQILDSETKKLYLEIMEGLNE